VQADEQVEKVGPAGSPSGDEVPGTCVTPGVKVVWAWPIPINTAISVIIMHNRTKTLNVRRNARQSIIAASHTGGRPHMDIAKGSFATLVLYSVLAFRWNVEDLSLLLDSFLCLIEPEPGYL
jgi:hypothetical protein